MPEYLVSRRAAPRFRDHWRRGRRDRERRTWMYRWAFVLVEEDISARAVHRRRKVAFGASPAGIELITVFRRLPFEVEHITEPTRVSHLVENGPRKAGIWADT